MRAAIESQIAPGMKKQRTSQEEGNFDVKTLGLIKLLNCSSLLNRFRFWCRRNNHYYIDASVDRRINGHSSQCSTISIG